MATRVATTQTPAEPADTPLRGRMLLDEPMSKHTSWRVGGPAQRFYLPADTADLVVLLRRLPAEEPVYWIGLGSNLLVRDGGLRGTVICAAGVLDGWELRLPEHLHVQAGLSCAKVARIAARAGLGGAEFLAGIPGTMGGALAMNAGAFGGETWRLVARAQTVDRHGRIRERGPEAFRTAYREVHGESGEWFLGAELHLAADPDRQASTRIKALLAQRNATQPTRQRSCGSVFRNPPGEHAARLIEHCGLKGRRIGAACVSEKHANFIVNLGQARAADIEALIALVQAQVLATHGVRLIPEVRIVGEMD
ncbi:MAG: UDP-N-acetylmuramate dehydrogenase [Gammaproteobacteria bacterium]